MSPDPATNTRQVAWVTGASRGIGYAVARALSENGWTVAASARDADALSALEAECAELPGVIRTFPLDITDADAAVRVVANIEGEFGEIAGAVAIDNGESGGGRVIGYRTATVEREEATHRRVVNHRSQPNRRRQIEHRQRNARRRGRQRRRPFDRFRNLLETAG